MSESINRADEAHQAEHALLAGCGLPAAWANQPQWRVLALGFGPGLHFLATWHAWQSDTQRPRMLHFVATDAQPLPAQDLLRHVRSFPQLAPLADELAAQWWGLLPGVHRLRFAGGRVLLTLLVGDSQAMLRQQDMVADSIYLGAHHADACSLHTLKAIARSARRGTRLAASATSAPLRKDVAQCGFVADTGADTNPLFATFDPAWEPKRTPLWPGTQTVDRAQLPQPSAVVIGAGIAGAASAQQLALRGWQVTVLDAAAEPAAGASALPAGIFAPHTSSDDSVLSRITRAGLRTTVQWAQALLQDGEDWQMTGVLERRMDGDAHALPPAWRGDSAAHDWSQHAPAERLAQAQLPADAPALWHPQGGWLRPARLVQALLAHERIRFQGGSNVASIQHNADRRAWLLHSASGELLAKADLVIVCAGPQSQTWWAAACDLQPIRGQALVGQAPAAIHSEAPFPLNGHGSWVPRFAQADGRASWIMGATFERDQQTLPPSAADRQAARADITGKLHTLLPAAAQPPAAALQQATLWAQVRCASPDRLPIVGPATVAAPQLWINTAMGSRGLTWALLCAELLAARLHGEPLPLPNNLALALSSDRFLGRS